MPGVRLHLLIYAILVMSIISDLVTTAACFQANDGIKETNLFYNYFGFWAFPLSFVPRCPYSLGDRVAS